MNGNILLRSALLCGLLAALLFLEKKQQNNKSQDLSTYPSYLC